MKKAVIAVVCHQGIGSSLWLKMLVQKIIAKYRIPAHVIQTDVTGLAGEEIDIVIGMNYLEDDIKKHGQTHIVLNNILDDELNDKLLNNKIIKELLGGP